jgi:hypothetical protein
MTGKTSGPHLHFLVTRDKLLNNYYWDDYPWGVTDPFGWQTDIIKDPWEQYSYQSNQGALSTYLWDESHYNTSIRFDLERYTNVNQTNITLNIPAQVTKTPSTLNIQSYSRPNNFTNMVYIPATSYLIEIYDMFGNQVKELNNTLEVTYNLFDALPSDISISNVAIYFWNEVKDVWEELTTTINNETSTIKANTNHLSRFAVFGKFNEDEIALTQIRVEGETDNEWYVTNPTIYLSNTDNNAYIIYSADLGANWFIYTNPFEFKTEGLGSILYRAIHQNGFEEPIQELTIKVNTKGKWLKTLLIKNSEFSTN